MGNIVLAKPKQKYWISYILQRIKKNKNFLGFVAGQTGSGKSYTTLRICEELDAEFNIDRIVFGGLELMNLINSGKLKRGSAICFEEIGVEMNAKNWFSVTNKMLNFLIQTFRHRGLILIMNSPYMDFVDASTRKLFHAEMTTLGIDFKKKQVKLKPLLIQYNSKLQKFYYKRLKVILKDGIYPIDIWKVDIPSKKLRLAYEKKKMEYTAKLNKRIYDELEAVENKGKIKAELTEIQQDTLDMLKQGYNVERISTERNRNASVVRATLILIKKKGYKLTPIYENGKIGSYTIENPL